MPPSAAAVGGGAAPGSGGQGAVAAGSISAGGGGGGGVAGEMASTELLSQFVRSDFDTNDYLRAAVRKDSVAEDLSHLKQGISALEAQLRQQVVSHHDRLIEQVSHAKDLEALVGTVSAGVSNLQDSLNKVKASVKEPYVQLQAKTTQLDRLQQAGEVLRRVIRVRELVEKLKKYMGIVDGKEARGVLKELAQAAMCMFEIRSSISLADLTGIDVIDQQKGYINECDTKIQAMAFDALNDSVLRRAQPEIGSALSVFLHLDMLPAAVEKLIANLLRLATTAVKEALDTSSLPIEAEDGKSRVALAAQKAKGPSGADASTWKTALWGRIETLMEMLLGKLSQAWVLYRVLCRKRDPGTQRLLLHLVSPGYAGEDARFFKSFWSRLAGAVASQLKASGDQSSFVRGMLVAEYPKLRATFVGMWETASRETEAGSSGVVGEAEKGAVLSSLDPFMQLHLARAQSRLSDAIAASFAAKPGGGGADATPLAKTIALVGGGGKGDPQLAASLGTVIDKAVTSFVASARDACPRDEGGGAHSGGRAVQVHNAAALVLGAVKNVGGRDGSVAALAALSGDVIAPLFSSLEATLSATMGGMHAAQVDAGADGDGDDFEECSPYVAKAAREVDAFSQRHAARLSASDALTAAKVRAADRLLRLFVRHACLVRPLTEAGKMKLIRDVTKLEEVAGRLANLKSPELHGPYQALRVLRPLLFVEDEPSKDLMQRMKSVEGVEAVTPQDFLHHCVQRLPPTVVFISNDPAGPSRQAALSAFVGQLDKGPEGGRRVVDALSAAGEGSGAAGGGFEADVMQLARSMM